MARDDDQQADRERVRRLFAVAEFLQRRAAKPWDGLPSRRRITRLVFWACFCRGHARDPRVKRPDQNPLRAYQPLRDSKAWKRALMQRRRRERQQAEQAHG